jgi:maleate isomerase
MRLGMLTPSSNTVLEPLTAEMLRDAPGVTAHFSRFRVLSIGLGEGQNAQFDPTPVVAAAALLADAKVHSLCWNGTSGAWLGLAADRALAAACTEATGIPATTCTLALMEALGRLGARRVALVTPYLASVQRAILGTLAREGFDCVAERHLEDPGNYSFAEHEEATVERLVREVVQGEGASRPEAVIIHCTNFRGTRLAPLLEAELGCVTLDSIAVALWGGMRAAGMAVPSLARWGRLFAIY